MAISYDTVDLNGTNKDVITVDGTLAGVIFKDSLDLDFDVHYLDIIQNGGEADMTANLEAYTMPNGQTADVYYADFIKDLADYADSLAENGDVVPPKHYDFTATVSQTDYTVSHNGNVLVFVDGVQTAPADLTDRSKVVLAAASGGEAVRIVVYSTATAN